MNSLSTAVIDSVRSSFAFSVDKFPLSGPESMRTPFYGLFRSDNLSVVGRPVTGRYVPHQTEDVLALVEAAANAFDGVAELKCHFSQGHYVSIQPSKEERLAVFDTADNVFPRIVIRAGYDGKAFKASLGYYRDLCRNLAILRRVSGTSVNIRHSVNLRPKMDELIRTFSALKGSWVKLADAIQHLESRQVQIVDFLRDIYGTPEPGRSETIHKNRTEAILQRLVDERFRSGRPRIENGTVSAWEAYNAVQGFVQHDATRKHVARLGDYGRAVAAYSDAAVIAAEELAFAA